MLTQLSTLKSRLGLLETEIQYDALLAAAIAAMSQRFERECKRRFGRQENCTQEFPADRVELCPACYPIESVARFEVKTTEAEGWVEQTGVSFLVREGCVLSLTVPLGNRRQQGRITYTGGYVLPGQTPGPGQAALPALLEQACIEQLVYWFQNRDRLGLERIWEYHATYRDFGDLDLLSSVRAVLFQFTRWEI